MVLFLDIREAIPLVNLMGVILTVMLIVQLRAHWDWGKIMPLLAGALPGIPVGVYLLKRMDPVHVQIILGLVLVAYAIYGLLFRLPVGKVGGFWAYIFGFIRRRAGRRNQRFGPLGDRLHLPSALDEGSDQGDPPGVFHHLRAAHRCLPRCKRAHDGGVIRNFLVSIPTLLAGTWFGSMLYGRFREEGYRQVMLVLLGALGVFTLARVL